MSEYRIGEFARKLCVTQDLLKHYEKYGILSSRKKGPGGYRYYDFTQSPLILFSRQLQNWGFPLKEISRIVKGLPLENTAGLLRQKLQDLKGQRKILNWQIRQLEELCVIMDQVGSRKFQGQWSIQEAGEYLFFPHTNGFDYLPNEKYQGELKKWINLQGITMQGALISGLHTAEADLIHGLVIPLDAAKDLNLNSELSCLTHFGKNRCLIYNCSLPDHDGMTTEKFLDKILQGPRNIGKKHNLELSDRALVLTFFLTREGEEIERHRRIFFPMA